MVGCKKQELRCKKGGLRCKKSTLCCNLDGKEQKEERLAVCQSLRAT